MFMVEVTAYLVQNIIVPACLAFFHLLLQVQDIFVRFSTLLNASGHYCRCTHGELSNKIQKV